MTMSHPALHRVPPAAALFAIALLAGCGGDEEAEAAAPVPVTVGAESVLLLRPDEIQTGPLLSGSLQADEQATIRAEVGGAVLDVSAEEGQRVRRGELLARIEDVAVSDAYQSARTATQTAQSASEIARRDLERARTLAEAGAVPTRNVETARVQLANAQAQLSAAQAQTASARDRLEATRVTAPFAGVVSRRAVNAGDVVAPGAELFTVIDPGSMELQASVPSSDLAALRVGTPVEFEVRGYPGQTFTGRIDRIAPAADPVTGQVPIFVSIPNRGGTLISGLFAQGRVTAETQTGLVVPAAAVDTDGPAPVVVRIRGGRAERVPVQLGIRDPRTERVQILSGVAAGDTLLFGAAREVTPGTPVRVGSAAPAAAQPK